MPAHHRPRATADLVRNRLGTRPVAVSDVLAIGVSPGQLRAATSAGTLARVRHGIVEVVTTPADARSLEGSGQAGGRGVSRRDHVRDARAALLELGIDSVVSHASAAVVHGLPLSLLRDEPQAVWVTAPRHGRIVAGTHRRLGVVDEIDRVDVDGVVCTDVARTALDLSRRRRLPQSLVVLDAAVARVGSEALWEACARLRWKRDLRLLHDALAVAHPLSESPLESTSRGVMILAGLPVPELQAWLHGADGRAYRLDFLWREQRVIGEADGMVKYEGIEDVRAEKRREDALRQAGYLVVRWTAEELRRNPDRVIARLLQALRR